MRERIRVAIDKVPLLLNDFFRHLHSRRRLRVFLCGQRPSDERRDLRIQVKNILEKKMGCESFLGEDIAEMREALRPDRDHLTIEVKEAEKSDLIIMFLGSPGTLAEITAFAMNRKTNPRTVVFNDLKYKDVKSFINLGPLKLLPTENLIYYNSSVDETPGEMVAQLDLVVAKGWFDAYYAEWWHTRQEMGFEAFLILATIYAMFPVRYAELDNILPFKNRVVNKTLNTLFEKHLIQKDEEKYIPKRSLEQSHLLGNCETDIAKTRVSLLNRRLKDENIVSDYRLVI